MTLSLASSRVTLQLSDSSTLRAMLNSRDFGHGRFFLQIISSDNQQDFPSYCFILGSCVQEDKEGRECGGKC